MKQFNSCQELIEYLISTYSYPSVGNYLLNDDEVEVYGGMMPRICIHIISPKYPRTLFFLQADEDVYGNIHFAILMNEGVNDELTCVSLPKKYLDELYLTMNNQVVEDSEDYDWVAMELKDDPDYEPQFKVEELPEDTLPF